MILRTSLAVCLVCSAPSASLVQAQTPAEKSPYTETAKWMVLHVARLPIVEKLGPKQHAEGLALWRKLYAKDTPPSYETPNFLLFGSLTGKKLPEIGQLAESYRVTALRSLDMQGEEPWPGKMALFLFTDRREFMQFSRSALKVKIEEEDNGAFEAENELVAAMIGPSLVKSAVKVDFNAEKVIGEQIGGAVLYRKSNGMLPEWMYRGFGRMVVLRTAGGVDLANERRLAAKFVLKRKPNVRDVLQAPLPYEESVVLKANLIDYFANNGRVNMFPAIINGFKPTEQKQEPNVFDALQSANIPADRLDPLWQAWVKSAK